jgi:NAD(P)-dependent dehydrogenase (short-subunit alcohol dehydrogenase family)
MESLQGKVAVVTGAASGMGLAFARRFARAGMDVVLADVEAPALDEAVAGVQALGVQALGVVTDVSDGASMDALAAASFERFARVHVVCNNAGVAGRITSDPGHIDTADWKWVLDVNLWGVIHGHRVFLPHLLEHGDGHIVNTASMAGHLPGHSAYAASKWAVVGITEGLFHAMQAARTGVGVSCLCPGWVNTRIGQSDRNRPEWAAPPALDEPTAAAEERMAYVREALASGMAPDAVADLVHDAIVGDRFWIFTDHRMVSVVEDRFRSVLEDRNPEPIGFLANRD